MAWYDFLFGAGPLKKAAAQGAPAQPVQTQAQSASLDMQKLAQQSADQQLAAQKKQQTKKKNFSDLTDEDE